MGMWGFKDWEQLLQVQICYSICLQTYNQFSPKHNSKHHMQTTHQRTLFHLVDNIKLKRFKLSRSQTPQTDQDQSSSHKKYWSKEQERLCLNIMSRYGTDYSMLKHHLPAKSRSQIKKKCTQIEQKRKRELERSENLRVQERRKDFFESEIMQFDMIKWHNIKPNKPETVFEADSN